MDRAVKSSDLKICKNTRANGGAGFFMDLWVKNIAKKVKGRVAVMYNNHSEIRRKGGKWYGNY